MSPPRDPDYGLQRLNRINLQHPMPDVVTAYKLHMQKMAVFVNTCTRTFIRIIYGRRASQLVGGIFRGAICAISGGYGFRNH